MSNLLFQQKKSVIETAADAAFQKEYSIQKGYYKDNYIKYFTKPKSSSSNQKYLPIINKGTYSRVRSIRNQVKSIIDENTKIRKNQTQIVNLGAGLDSLYFQLKEEYSDEIHNFNEQINFVELDYFEITAQKIKTINKTKELLEKIEFLDEDEKENLTEKEKDKNKLISKGYSILNCDLSNQIEVEKGFEISKIKKSVLTIIIGECLFCYLENKKIHTLLSFFNSFFENSVIIYFDLINPNDEFGKVMINNLKVYRNIVLPSFEDCPFESSHVKRCVESGYDTFNICIDMLSYYNTYISNEEHVRLNHLELMDELEEWNLLQRHYCIGVSIKIKSPDMFGYLKDYELK